jgi:flagellar biosynthesis anti-sigma factor FlgM
MKISSEQAIRANAIDPIPATQSNPQKSTPTSTPGNGPAAIVDLSAQAQALTAAKSEAAGYLSAVKAAPDTRTDLVAKLKSQVDSGTYHVNSSDIADQILRRAQADNIK